MINFTKILLQFGSFKIHFMKIHLSFIILRKTSKIQYIFRNFKIPILKNIINIVKYYVKKYSKMADPLNPKQSIKVYKSRYINFL